MSDFHAESAEMSNKRKVKVIPMYDELIEELRQHHCDAKEDDTQEVCEECAYDVIIADKSAPSGIASVCVCGLMNRAADAIEELQKQLQKSEVDNINLTGWLAEEHAKLDRAEIENIKLKEEFAKYRGKHRWIPVTERLPEKYDRVLVYSKATRMGRSIDFINADGNWYTTPKVSHWMPLPQPPEGGDEHGNYAWKLNIEAD